LSNFEEEYHKMSEDKDAYPFLPMFSMQISRYAYQIPYFYQRWIRPERTFIFCGKPYQYFLHPYNTTWRNERCVELAIVMEYLRNQNPAEILEVGNVLSHYVRSAHTVIDRYERGRSVIAQDIVDYQSNQSYKLVLCISTLEHIGFDERPQNPGKYKQAIQVMRSVLTRDGKLIVTVPLGYNPAIDSDLEAGRLPFDEIHFLKRTSYETWLEAQWNDVKDVAYGTPFRAANAIAVCVGGPML
jgi:hypothetical protein